MIKKENPQICLSISSSPGKFGETVHNAGYEFHKINYIYKAIKVQNLRKTISSLRELNIKGCSVSMPFKEMVIKHLDRLDPLVKKTGAVNTILNEKNKLIGFNTDVNGASKALRFLNIKSNNTVLILGAGGVSRAIIIALRNMGVRKITVTNRSVKKLKKLVKLFKCDSLNWENRNQFKSDILINATSIGMNGNLGSPVHTKSISNFKKVMDVVVRNQDTAVIKQAKKLNIPNVSGVIMTFHQAAEQYQIYTGLKAPIKHMVASYNKKWGLKINI